MKRITTKALSVLMLVAAVVFAVGCKPEESGDVRVTTYEPQDITATTAKCGGDVIVTQGLSIDELGICWSTERNPTIEDSHLSTSIWNQTFVRTIMGLEPGTVYHVRAFALRGLEYYYGEDMKFTTLGGELPIVSTLVVTNVTSSTALCGGNVTSDGGLPVIERGVCWSTSDNPTITDDHVMIGSGTGSFTTILNGLLSNTTYHVRAFAVNSHGTAYGLDETFTTKGGELPTVSTLVVTNITSSTALCGGNVTSDGGLPVIERGVCWSTSDNPTIIDDHVMIGSGTGSFTTTLDGLSANTTYHVRAYAVNSCGIAFGLDYSFNTTFGDGSGTYNGHDYIDLGLPSGTMWATCNVGADRPEGYGDYFAWGETQQKTTYTWATYQHCNGEDHKLTKYCNMASFGNKGYTDNYTVLRSDDDAATANWGDRWSMPTDAQWQELWANTTNRWTTQNGINGRLITATNGNSIFLPAGGYYWIETLNRVGTDGNYWSRSLDTTGPNNALYSKFYAGNHSSGPYDRSVGYTVRPVFH